METFFRKVAYQMCNFAKKCLHLWCFFQNGCSVEHLYRPASEIEDTTKNTVISPNFMVWKFCKIHTKKLGKITVFYVVKKFFGARHMNNVI